MKKGFLLIITFYYSFSLLIAQSQRLEDLQDALPLATSHSFAKVLAQMTPLIDLLDFPAAQSELEKVIETCRTSAHRRLSLPVAYDMLAAVCQKHKQPDLALDYYLQSTDIYEKEAFKQALAHTYYRIGFFYFASKQYSMADTYLRKALKTAADSLESRQVINAYNAIALCYKEVKNYPMTTKYFEKAMEVAQKSQDSVWIGIMYDNIITAYSEKAAYQEEFRRAYYAQSLYKKATNLAALEQKHRFEAEKKELESRLNDYIEKYYFLQIGMMSSLVSLVFISLLLLLSYRKIQKIKQITQSQAIEIQQQQEELSNMQTQ